MANTLQPDLTHAPFQQVSDTAYIHALLQSLVRRRVLVGVSLPGSDIQYTSTVLEFDLQGGYLLLDEIFPLGANSLLEMSPQLTLHARVAGAVLAFSTELQASVSEQGVHLYRLAIPDRVDYWQRREGHRVVVEELEIHVEVSDHQGRVHRGQLRDISTGGVSLVLPSVQGLHTNGVYRCTLFLPAESPFDCTLDIVSIRGEGTDDFLLGASFVGMEREGENRVQRTVTALERSLARRRHTQSSVTIGEKG